MCGSYGSLLQVISTISICPTTPRLQTEETEIRGKIRNSISAEHIVSLFVGAVFAAIIIRCLSMSDMKAGIGCLGVIVGSGISATASWLAAKENRTQQWRIAAIDKRLEVHQAAYALCTRITAIARSGNIGEVVIEGEKWRQDNCMYLDATSRNAFKICLFSVMHHGDLLDVPRPRDEETNKKIKENWQKKIKPGRTQPAGVAMPHLGDREGQF